MNQHGNLTWKGDPCQPINGAQYYWDYDEEVWYFYHKGHWRRVSDGLPID